VTDGGVADGRIELTPEVIVTPSPVASPTPPPQVGRILGQVTDSETSAGINGANVSLDTGEQTVTSTVGGQDGVYSFDNVAVGDRTITAAATGYITNTKTVTVTDGGVAD
ncbi:carboxypeptidase-like regulatory domain-containing protein, partial [Pseudomonas sp. PS1]